VKGDDERSPDEKRKISVAIDMNKDKDKEKKSSNDDDNQHNEVSADQIYYATFDATALSTAWMSVGKEAVAHEQRIRQREQKKKGRPVTTAVTSTPLEAAPHPLQLVLTPTEIAKRTVESAGLFAQLGFSIMHPMNAMLFILMRKPLILLMTSGTSQDLLYAKAATVAMATFRKKGWTSKYTFVQVPPLAVQQFELARVFNLNKHVISVGALMPTPENMNPTTISIPVEFR
jgi:hypothetical protein